MALRSPYTNPAEFRGIIRRRAKAAIRHLSWFYLALMLGFWGYLHWQSDRSWSGMLALFGPVWMALIPAMVLVPAALFFSRRALWVLAATLCIVLFPIMGLCIPWRTIIHSPGGGQHLRIMTCNVSQHAASDAALGALVGEAEPEVVVLQEWPIGRKLPTFVDSAWHWRVDGELLIASRYPIENVVNFTDPAWGNWGGSVEQYEIAAPGGSIRLFSLHLASPHIPLQDFIDGKPTGQHSLEVHLAVRDEQSQRIRRLAEQFGGQAIVAGDFNSIAEGTIFRHAWKNFSDAFCVAGLGLGHTYFSEGAAVRIDHILAGSDWQVNDCRVGPDIGSPHRPVIADLERVRR